MTTTFNERIVGNKIALKMTNLIFPEQKASHIKVPRNGVSKKVAFFTFFFFIYLGYRKSH